MTMLSSLLPLIEQNLKSYLANPKIPPAFARALNYVVLDGGKRLRPLLVYAIGLDLGADIQNLHAAACAVEFIHCYSLVHDDLPAMDNDDYRRGKLSCHKAFDEATAILVGDALQSLAFEILDDVSMVQALASAVGAAGMVGGQFLDIEHQAGKPVDLIQLRLLKTAKLFEAAALMAAVAAKVDLKKRAQISEFALNAGMLFQIKDDKDDQEATVDSAPYLAGVQDFIKGKQYVTQWQTLALLA